MEVSEIAKKFITEEQAILKDVLSKLRLQLASCQSKLATEQVKARELTSEIVAAYRPEEKQMLASDEAVAHALSHKKNLEIKTIAELIENPYFARLVVEEEVNGRTVTREYRLGTHANPECRIIDWRHAPISKLFYEYQEGEEFCEEIQGVERFGTIVKRHSVFIENGQLLQLKCQLGNFELTEGKWSLVEHASSSFGRSSYGSLPSILSLITQEQFSAITEDAKSSVIIEGVAGSGKTSVALYRLSWLLHQKESKLNQDNAIILVKSLILKNYISKSLASVDIHGCTVKTYEEWCDETLKNSGVEYTTIEQQVTLELVSFLHSTQLLTAIEKQELERKDKIAQTIKDKIDWSSIPSGIGKVFERELYKVNSADSLLKHVQEACYKLLDSVRLTGEKQRAVENTIQTINNSLKSLPSIFERISEVLSSHYDGALDLINKLNSRQITEDFIPVLLRVMQLTNHLGASANKRYEHIVIDEAQDLTPIEFATIVGASTPTGQLTVVGDRAQKITMHHHESTYDLLETGWGSTKGFTDSIKLKVSYRCTQEISELADYVKARSGTQGGRKGQRPIYYFCQNEELAIESTKSWIDQQIKKQAGAAICLLCSNPAERRQLASFLSPTYGNALHELSNHNYEFDTGLIVSDIATAKGLEFKSVLIWDVSNSQFPKTKQFQNLLHVAITRAEDNLALVNWQTAASFLPNVNNKLLDVFVVEAEPEEPPIELY